MKIKGLVVFLGLCKFTFSFNVIEEKHLDFRLIPFGNQKLKSSGSSDTDSSICINNTVALTNQKDLLLIKLNIESVIPLYTNLNRFGGSTVSRGKQFMRLQIRAFPSGHLLRFKKYLPNGEHHIVLNFLDFNDKWLEICLINLSYDASWTSMDLDNDVKLAVTSVAQEQKLLEDHFQNVNTPNRHVVFNDTLTVLQEMNNYWVDPEWTQLQNEKRSFDEDTFTWILNQMIILILSLIINFIYVVWRVNH